MPDLEFLKNDSTPSTETHSKKSFVPARFQKLLKYKWFVVGLGVVVILGFYALITRKQNSVEDVSSSDAGAGYLLDTYPEASGGSYTGLGSSGGVTTSNDYQNSSGTSDNDVIDAVNDTMSNTVDNVKGYVDIKMKDLTDTYDTSNSNIVSNLDTLNEQVKNQDNTIAQQADKISRDSVINAMKQNSELWNISTDPTQKQNYSDANKKLAEQIGAIFDSNTGNWKDSTGNILYYSSTQQHGINKVETVTGKSPSQATAQDYIKVMQSNSLKYKNSTSDTEKAQLAKENEALGALAGLHKDSASGKWYTAGGSDAWDYSANYVDYTPTKSSDSTNITKNPSMPMGTKTVTTKTIPDSTTLNKTVPITKTINATPNQVPGTTSTGKVNMFITDSPFKPAPSSKTSTTKTSTTTKSSNPPSIKSSATYGANVGTNKRNLPTVQDTTVYNDPIAKNFLKASKAKR